MGTGDSTPPGGLYIFIHIRPWGYDVALTSVDLDPQLIEQARAVTGEKSNRAVLTLALRRLIASKRKGEMIDGILALTDLPDGLGAPVISYERPAS